LKTYCAIVVTAFLAAAKTAGPQPPSKPPPRPVLSPSVKDFVLYDATVMALTHLTVIDGTGGNSRKDQTIILSGGRIEAVGDSDKVAIPQGAQVLALAGRAALPGLVGMHDHLFYFAKIADMRHGQFEGPGILVSEIAYSAPRLYLAAGVTTIRTTGSVEPYADLKVKAEIDQGKMPGPKVHATAPFLEGGPTEFAQLHELRGPDDARRFVDYWAEQGFTSFKAYIHITRADLSAAIQAAHKRKLKVTGHLCSIGFREAAALGIDNLEHGFIVDTEFVPNKQPDVCPPGKAFSEAFDQLDPNGDEARKTIDELVRRKVAVTSTLPVLELRVPGRPVLNPKVLSVLLPEARNNYFLRKALSNEQATPAAPAAFKKEMQLELAFARAGGLLLTGCDPTGMGGVIPGFADLRGVELLSEAGFSPVEAIRIATLNGAQFLGESSSIGSIEKGKQADLLIVKGDPSSNISDIENVELVFKDGVAYDPSKLIDSVRGLVGLR